jgi:hypothetical protein
VRVPDIAGMVADYRSGMSQTAIGKKHGYCQATISGYLRSQGIVGAVKQRQVNRKQRDGRTQSSEASEVTIHRIAHPTVAWWFSQHEPAHELQEIEL